MVLDLKRFTPGSELPAGLLWVAEQIPGLVASADLTEQLARGYFPSYNIPYFPQVLNLLLSGFCIWGREADVVSAWASQEQGLAASADAPIQFAPCTDSVDNPLQDVTLLQVYNESGLQALRDSLSARGPEFSNSIAWLSYQLTPRATIFRRDAASVSTLDDMRRIMRSNSFMTDEVHTRLSSAQFGLCKGASASLHLTASRIAGRHADL